MIDFIIRIVPNYGYLPIIERDGVEVYRGDFHPNALSAVERCGQVLPIILKRLADADDSNG